MNYIVVGSILWSTSIKGTDYTPNSCFLSTLSRHETLKIITLYNIMCFVPFSECVLRDTASNSELIRIAARNKWKLFETLNRAGQAVDR